MYSNLLSFDLFAKKRKIQIVIFILFVIFNSKFKPMNVTAIWYSSSVDEDDDSGDDLL